MNTPYQVLSRNASLLNGKVSKHSIIGLMIAIIAVIIATILSGYFSFGEVTLYAFLKAQQTNMTLWFLDLMPFVFAIWGQYVSQMLSLEAGAMVLDQTKELWANTVAIEKKAAYESTHDSLTNLPNRTLFLDRLQQAIISAQREKYSLAVFLLDIDRFKEVNDTLGHYNGDRLLNQVALRLSGVIRKSDTLARIGGDEFAFLLPKPGGIEKVGSLAKKIKSSLAPPFALENLTLDVQASIGAVLFPDHGKDVDTLMQRVDVAMYVAKQDNIGFVIYSRDLDEHSPHRLTLMGELREGIKCDELQLYYQPKIQSASGKLHSVEALVRWQHKVHGLMPPDDFIPLAERTGLIQDLTLWVLKESLKQCAEWHKQNMNIGVAVNLSPQCLLNPEFPEILTGLLASYGFPAEFLTLEITETSIMAGADRSLKILERINEMGVSFSIDDFGTGYSSLAYLKKLPVSEIKIDKSFVMEMQKNESDATIVKATIQLGHNLGLKVVAEGVEDEQTYLALKDMGCDVLQGYFISRPVPVKDFMDWVQAKAKDNMPSKVK
jgi:diguanylate cyclase (GGDEF)-like protein